MLSPRAIVQTPTNPANANIAVSFQLIDREKENGNVILEYSTDSGVTFKTATLVDTSETQNLPSEWYPGITHTIHWDSVTDMVGISGNASVIVKVTPSDATNPSGGSPGVSGTFTVNNVAYNSPPTATLSELSGVKLGNIRVDYSLIDIKSDTCSIVVEYSTDGGDTWTSATMGSAGDDHAESIQQTSDGGYIVAGRTRSFGATGSRVLRLASDGTIAFNPASGAQMIDTNVVPVDTNASVSDTTATVTDTSATATDTNATIEQQAP